MLDETGIVLKSWFSLKECSKDLGITVPGVSKRIKRNIQFIFYNKTCVLKTELASVPQTQEVVN